MYNVRRKFISKLVLSHQNLQVQHSLWSKVKSYNCHKNKIRTNEPKIWQNNKNTEPQPKLSGSYKKKCIENDLRKDNGSKTRFIRRSSFGIKQYIKHSEAPKLLKLKLNMVDLKANFRGKMKMLFIGGVEFMRNMSNICGNAPYLKIKTCLILQTCKK